MTPDAHPAAAWDQFCETLRELGHQVARTPGADIDHAEGLRLLTHLLRSNFERHVEGDHGHPHFTRVGPLLKFLGDNPDTVYDTTALSPQHHYKITGQRGTAHYLSFTLYGGGSAEVRIVADLNDQKITTAADGSFEITLAPEQVPGNWMELAPDSHMLIVRQYFLDRETETPATYQIETLGPVQGQSPLTGDDFARQLDRVQQSMRVVLGTTTEQLKLLRSAPANRFGELLASADDEAGSVLLRAYPTPDNDYTWCLFQLDDDQALTIHFTPPACHYWGVHLSNLWWQSLDYRSRPVALNNHSAVLEPDGSVRIVVAHRDPGVPNWLDTAGHHEGSVLVRWLLPEQRGIAVLPSTQVVPITSLANER